MFADQWKALTSLHAKQSTLHSIMDYVSKKHVNSLVSNMHLAEILEELESLKIKPKPISSNQNPIDSPCVSKSARKIYEKNADDSAKSDNFQDFASVVTAIMGLKKPETRNSIEVHGLQKMIKEELENIKKVENALGIFKDSNIVRASNKTIMTLKKRTTRISSIPLFSKNLVGAGEVGNDREEDEDSEDVLDDMMSIVSIALRGGALEALPRPVQIEDEVAKVWASTLTTEENRLDADDNADADYDPSDGELLLNSLVSEDSYRDLRDVRLALAQQEYFLRLLTSAKDLNMAKGNSAARVNKEKSEVVSEIQRAAASVQRLSQARANSQIRFKELKDQRELLRSNYLHLFPDLWAEIPRSHYILSADNSSY
jgi:IS30 family transposase